MTFGEIAALVMSIFAVLGVTVTILRNGRDHRAADGKRREEMAGFEATITTELKNIKGEIKSPDHGLVALARGQANFKTEVVEVTTRLGERVGENARDIEELKKHSH